MQGLRPILIQYSSPSHREGVRSYFKGQYKIDYGLNRNKSQITQRLKSIMHPLSHYRSHTQNIANYSQQKCLAHNKRYSTYCEEDCIRLGKQKQFQNGKLQIQRQEIVLPKISKSSLTNPQQTKVIKRKKNLYICGDTKCPTKMHESMALAPKKKKQKSSIKPRQLRIPSVPEIRKRYTPTFVCSKDNPLPCFKIYESSS